MIQEDVERYRDYLTGNFISNSFIHPERFSFVEKAIHKAYLFTENRGDFTITTDDLREAFRLMNKSLPVEAPQTIFGEMNDYKSEDDEDYVPEDEEMQMDQDEPLEWDSDAELEESQQDEVEEDVEEVEESKWAFNHELMNDVVNHYIDIITPSDNPEEEVEAEESETDLKPRTKRSLKLRKWMLNSKELNYFNRWHKTLFKVSF